jgi:NADH:ubiquinone oxidoreductase subunit 2 (subunit N)
MLFILFAAWLASWIDINAGNQYLLQSSMLLLGLGFAFLLAIFPFMSWLAMIGEKNHSFLVAFVYSNYFFGIILFGIRFILEGGWLSPDVNIQLPLQATGLLMLGTGGILAVFTRHLGRLTGVIAMGYIGRMLLSISLFLNGFPILFAVVIIHILALGLWSLSLSILRELSGELSYQKIEGGWWQWPLVTSGIVLGYYCLAGLPPLAGFPIYWALGSGLSGISFSLALVYAAASSGYIIGGLRLISVLAKNSGEEFVLLPGRPFYRYVILVLMLGLILLGIFPGFLLEITESISTVLVSF